MPWPSSCGPARPSQRLAGFVRQKAGLVDEIRLVVLETGVTWAT
jgi:hypothetical protein